MSTPNVKEAVREKYGQAALRVKSDEAAAAVGLQFQRSAVIR